MVKYYLEIFEEVNELEKYRPREHCLLYVNNEAEAESKYVEEVTKFNTDKIKAQFIEMNHDPDPSKNKPCRVKEIKNGKVAAEWL